MKNMPNQNTLYYHCEKNIAQEVCKTFITRHHLSGFSLLFASAETFSRIIRMTIFKQLAALGDKG